MIVKIIIGPQNYDIESLYVKDDNEFVIGVDQGCTIAYNANIDIDLALGDFDSIDKESLNPIKLQDNVVTYPVRKNYTDSYIAIQEALKMNPSEIIIYGGIGGRLDHTFANIKLMQLGSITMINNQTKVYMLDPGKYVIENNYDYVSFFALEDISGLTLTGFSYDLDNYQLTEEDPLCISNQGSGEVSFNEGLLLVIHSKE